ncbi:MAG: Ferredoxin, 2Fe-2S [Ktedonobacterales bacterium]|jgi:nitrite reductase/ring-hydroxylating ferredoxin subunit/uncharacterized membrane protein|nr:MAG: Ferredoxin, 2Fe-2S [Ktedonobacterales bacterium]
MTDPQVPASTTDTDTIDTSSESRTPFTDRLSDNLQSIIKALTGANARPPRRLKTLLSGTWLRHPLHPLLTDVPVGAWLLTVVFDIVWLISPNGNAWAARAAEGTVILGTLAALAAVVTGLADWSDSYGAERTTGLYHGLLNSGATILYIISVVLRLTQTTGESTAAAVIGFAGFVVMTIGAYLGGDMVFAKGTQVNHTAWEAAGDDYEAVLPVAEAPANALFRVTVSGVPVALLKLNDKFFAIAATCTHAGGPLDEGELQGDVVQCPWHGSRFSVRTGQAITGPASIAQPRYDVRIRDGQIELKRIGGH